MRVQVGDGQGGTLGVPIPSPLQLAFPPSHTSLPSYPTHPQPQPTLPALTLPPALPPHLISPTTSAVSSRFPFPSSSSSPTFQTAAASPLTPVPSSTSISAPRPQRARMNWTSSVGSRIARSTLITAKTVEPWRPHVSCEAGAVACVVWSSGSGEEPDETRSRRRSVAEKAQEGKGKGKQRHDGAAYDLTTWATFRVLPIARRLPMMDGLPSRSFLSSTDERGRPWRRWMFFHLHHPPPGLGGAERGEGGFGRLRTVPEWKDGEAWVCFMPYESVVLRAHWDPLVRPFSFRLKSWRN